MEPELVRVQVLQVQVAARMQAQPQVQLEPLVQAQPQPLMQAQPQLQLELKRHLQRNRPKPQLHRHHCKVPDRSREPQ